MTEAARSSEEHPVEQELRDFALGELDDIRLQRVADHLARCPACLSQLGQLANQNASLLEGLRRGGSRTDELPEGMHYTTPDLSVDDLNREPAREAIDRQGKYRVLRRLGTGGMGSVYLAEHLVMNRKVAIKVIRHEYVANPQAVLRFQNEMRSAARLSHRNIVTVHDADQAEEFHFLVMEFVPGSPLSQVVRESGPLPVSQACDFALQVAAALNHAFQRNMIHRDIKPANLMCTPRGIIKVLDFGLARVTDITQDETLTTTGTMMGTADYMSPEQARDAKSADIRSDLYSLGCTLYFLLAGRPPFDLDNRIDKIVAHRSTPFPRIVQTRSDVPLGVDQIIQKLTAKEPGQRYQTPRDLNPDLRRYAQARAADETIHDETVVPESASEPVVAPTTMHVREPAETQVGLGMKSPPQRTKTSRPSVLGRHGVVIVAGVALVAIALIATTGLVGMLGGNGDRPMASGGAGGDAPRVLLVMSSTRFWFSDYLPVTTILRDNGIDVVVTADRAGTAQYNPIPLDTAPNKHSVVIDQGVSELVADEIFNDIDAVVFIGTDTEEFRRADEIGDSIRTLLSQLQQQDKWICSVGKGSEVPISYGVYDGVEVCTSEYLDQSLLDPTRAILVERNVHTVADSKVLTCSSWDDAAEFSRTLSRILWADAN